MTLPTTIKDIREEFLPFGALVIRDSEGRHVETRFRGWSPQHVPVLQVNGTEYPMEDCGPAEGESERAGWSELVLPSTAAPIGSLYAFGFPTEGSAELHFVPDFASFGLKDGVHGKSIVTDLEHTPSVENWEGVPAHRVRALLMHIGTDTKNGTFRALIDELDEYRDRGFTMIEPLNWGAFNGREGWGFDCVQPMSPHEPYGTMADLMAAVDACHQRGIGFSCQLIQNHFGGFGNYLAAYAPTFFDGETPWGSGINFANPDVRLYFKQAVRIYAKYARVDMFRFDAVHRVFDQSPSHILDELYAEAKAIGHEQGRHVIIVHENEKDDVGFSHIGKRSDAIWADAIGHTVKCALGGPAVDVAYLRNYLRDGGDRTADDYFITTPPDPRAAVRAMAEALRLGGYNEKLGDPARIAGEGLGPNKDYGAMNAIVHAETHDQQGNTVRGEGFEAAMLQDELYGMAKLKAYIAFTLLQPSIPMVWNHFGRNTPFPFFHDHAGAEQVIFEGRQKELQAAGYSRDYVETYMLDPADKEGTYKIACLYGDDGQLKAPLMAELDDEMRRLMSFRAHAIEPQLALGNPGQAPDVITLGDDQGIMAQWNLAGIYYRFAMNFSDQPLAVPAVDWDADVETSTLGSLAPGTHLPPFGYASQRVGHAGRAMSSDMKEMPSLQVS